jgi:hypothetical protein
VYFANGVFANYFYNQNVFAICVFAIGICNRYLQSVFAIGIFDVFAIGVFGVFGILVYLVYLRKCKDGHVTISTDGVL